MNFPSSDERKRKAFDAMRQAVNEDLSGKEAQYLVKKALERPKRMTLIPRNYKPWIDRSNPDP